MQSNTRTLKKISLIPYDNKQRLLLLSNVMSLAPKIDEVGNVSVTNNLDIICNIEFWLQNHILENNYNLIRQDRNTSIHGGVCAYIRKTIFWEVLLVLNLNSRAMGLSLQATLIKLNTSRLLNAFRLIFWI